MNDSQIVSDLQLLDLEDLLALHGSLLSYGPSKQGTYAEEDLQREWARKAIRPFTSIYILMLFDGERHCTAVDKLVFFFQALSPHLAPHLLCVKLIFSDDEKHLG